MRVPIATLFAAALAVLPGVAGAQTVCAIQGTGADSPVAGSRVTTTAVVTADFTATPLAGFFVQDPVCDADPATSDGIFVHVAIPGIVVRVGDRVAVTGRVAESAGETIVEAESVRSEGAFSGGVEVVTLAPPAEPDAAAAYLEAREGMLVSLPASRVVGATDARGVAYLMPEASGVERLFPGGEDGRKIAIAAPGGWLALDHGDRLARAVGCVRFAAGEYVAQVPSGREPSVEASAVAPQAGSAAGALRLASYALGELFDATDDPGVDDTVVDAATYATGLSRRAASIARWLEAPDVLAVQEVESEGVLAELAVQPEIAAAGYRAIVVDGPDPRGLDVGLLVRSDRVRVLSAEARPACTDLPGSGAGPCDGAGGGANSLFARPPLVARLESVAGARLSVIAAQFATGGDGAAEDALLVAMAQHVRGLVEEQLAAEPDVPIVVAGDLEALPGSVSLAVLVGDGRLLDAGGSATEYTRLREGVSGRHDYVLVDSRLAGRLAAAGPVHVNVDFSHPGPGADTPRVSDHDPVLVGLDP